MCGEFDADEAAESLTAAVADEFTERLNRGERPSVDEYAVRYPQIAPVLRDVLPALRVMHQPGSSFLPVSPAATASAPEPISGCLGDFRIRHEVGRGGMGVVYEAEQISLSRRVALKVLPFAAALDSKQLERFKREAQAAAHLHHTNIVPVYSVGCERGVYYYAMQFIEGQSLAQLIAELAAQAEAARNQGVGADRARTIEDSPDANPANGAQGVQNRAKSCASGLSQTASMIVSGEISFGGAFGSSAADASQESSGAPSREQSAGASFASARPAPPTQPQALVSTHQSIHGPAFFRSVATIGVQAAEALEHAHSLGIVHRDIKPANLLLDGRAHLWVTDFGLARYEADVDLTRSGDMLGTLRYMSPEQALVHRGVVDHRTDIYSLGATLYELLTLRPVWDGDDRRELLRQITFDEPTPPRRINRKIPTDLETIILKALSKDARDRYATAADLAADLQRFLDNKSICARKPTLAERAAKWSRRHRAVVVSGVVLLVMAVVALSVSNVTIARARSKTATAYELLAQEQRATESAYNLLSKEQAATKLAFEAEAQQRLRAEMNFEQARQMLDFFVQVSEEELADKPEVQEVRRKLLESALKYYQGFLKQCGDDPAAQAELASSLFRLASVFNEIGAKPDALVAFEQAREVQEKLAREHPDDAEIQRGLFSIYRHLGVLRGSEQFSLLNQESVRQHLNLSPDQVQQIETLAEARREAFFKQPPHRFNLSPDEVKALFEQKARETQQVLGTVLTAAQLERLNQISLQLRGTQAFSSPEVAVSLGLTASQTERIRTIKDEAFRGLRESYRSSRSADSDSRRKYKASRQSTNEKLLGVLTAEQMTRWRTLAGEPFNGELRFDYHCTFHSRHNSRYGDKKDPTTDDQDDRPEVRELARSPAVPTEEEPSSPDDPEEF